MYLRCGSPQGEAGGIDWRTSVTPVILLSLALSTSSFAAEVSTANAVPWYKRWFGITYFTFFDGPGIGEDFSKTPNNLGNASDRGWSIWTNLSARLKFTDRIALDYQFRLQQIITNEPEFRYQGGRLGVSGTFVKIDDPAFTLTWTGAINSDIPGIGGQVNDERRLIMNPGLFTQFSLRPKTSRFSLYALISPRFWLYSDQSAMDRQSLEAGWKPGQKPLVALNFQPSINFDLAPELARRGEALTLRTGMTFDVRMNANDSGLRRWFWPVDLGVAYDFSSALSIYPHIRFSGPWDDGLRAELGASRQAWYDTLSMGLWVSGTIL